MPDLDEYELPDGTTVQLAAEDVKRYPGAKKVASTGAKEHEQHEPVKNRARQN